MDRLVALRGMCSPSNSSGITASRILQAEEWESDDEWGYEGESPSNRCEVDNQPSSFGSAIDQLPGEDEEGEVIYFFAGTHTGLSHWQFHQYDDDFFPSVPHGHLDGKKQVKLDPYQGWVYKGSTQLRREPKKNIISLWNDHQFREFALEAINYYLSHHPIYNGWRVANPRRLPRRR